MDGSRLIIENTNSGSYTVYLLGETESLSEFDYNMLMSNIIKGVRGFIDEKRENGTAIIYKNNDVKGAPLSMLLRNLGKDSIIRILISMANVLINAEEYMLHEQNFVFDNRYIYIDANTFEAYMIYVPTEQTSDLMFPQFIRDLMTYGDFIQTESQEYCMTILRKMNSNPHMPANEVKEFLQGFLSPSGAPARQPVPNAAQWSAPQNAPAPQANVPPRVQQNVRPNIQPNIQPNMQPNRQPNMQPNIQPNIQPNMPPKPNVFAGNNAVNAPMPQNNPPFMGGRGAEPKPPAKNNSMFKKDNEPKQRKNNNKNYGGLIAGMAIPGEATPPAAPAPYKPAPAAPVSAPPMAARQAPQAPNYAPPEEGNKGIMSKLFSGGKKSKKEKSPASVPPMPAQVGVFPAPAPVEEPVVSSKTVLINAYAPMGKRTGYLINKFGQRLQINKVSFMIGKHKTGGIMNDFDINNPAVSGQHAVIITKENRFFVNDLGSLNGTFVKGARIAPHVDIEITDGDDVMFANEKFKFVIVQE